MHMFKHSRHKKISEEWERGNFFVFSKGDLPHLNLVGVYLLLAHPYTRLTSYQSKHVLWRSLSMTSNCVQLMKYWHLKRTFSIMLTWHALLKILTSNSSPPIAYHKCLFTWRHCNSNYKTIDPLILLRFYPVSWCIRAAGNYYSHKVSLEFRSFRLEAAFLHNWRAVMLVKKVT